MIAIKGENQQKTHNSRWYQEMNPGRIGGGRQGDLKHPPPIHVPFTPASTPSRRDSCLLALFLL